MSVMQRKLFANKEARTKLRDMGGIMSSFPELSGEVQRFNNGMMVEAPTAAPASAGARTYNDFVAAARAGQPLGEQELIRSVEAGMLTPQQAADAQAMMDGYVPSEQEVRAATAPGPTPMTDMGYIPPTGYQALENLILGVGGETRAEKQAREEEYAARAGEDYTQRVPDAAPAEEEPVPAEEEPGMTTGTPIYEQRIADLLPTSTETPDETGGGETDTSDLRARAEERIKLFQDLFGSDEPTARDRAMQFAMIGLAIAAGQSPNALTNIASGLLAGTQAMTAQEAERRKERRDLRSSAVTSVLNELEAERKAAAEAAKRSGEDYQPTESYADAVLKMTDTLIKEGEDPVAADRLARQLVDPLYGRGTPVDTGTVERGRQLVQQLRDSGRTDTEIARLVREAGLDPADLGVTDGQ